MTIEERFKEIIKNDKLIDIIKDDIGSLPTNYVGPDNKEIDESIQKIRKQTQDIIDDGNKGIDNLASENHFTKDLILREMIKTETKEIKLNFKGQNYIGSLINKGSNQDLSQIENVTFIYSKV